MSEIVNSEARISKLESDMSHMAESVNSLSKTVGDGFAEMRKTIVDIEKSSEQRASRLHERIEQHQMESVEDGKLQWPLVISFILLVIAIGGVIAGYVNMTTKFEAEIAHVEREWLLKYMETTDKAERERNDLLYEMHENADKIRFEVANNKRRKNEASNAVN